MKLLPFAPSSQSAEIQMEAQIEMQPQGFLITFELSGPGVASVLLSPKNEKPSRKNDLWKETCFECFFGVGHSKEYFEFNGSPSGDWALYAFQQYRDGMKEVVLNPVDSPILLKCEKSADYLCCVWRVPYFSTAILQNASLTAVLKTGPGAADVSYWASKHAGAKPDFHLRESFIHRLF